MPYPTLLRDPSNRTIGGINMLVDITERKKSETNLQRLNEQLETEVSARTRELEQSHERLRALATELNLTEQEERKKIATELHDHLAQLLVLGKLKLEQSRRQTESPEKRDALMEEMDEVLSDALAYTRTLVVELSPAILYEFGLPAALKWLGERMQRHGLAVTVHSETEPLKLLDDQAVPLFQSIRELLMNVAKHAQSGKATVRLESRSNELRIEVRDDGVGFDPATVDTPAMSLHFGLFSIRERMRALGGRFELDSAPGQGTTATLVLPLGEVRGKGLVAPNTPHASPLTSAGAVGGRSRHDSAGIAERVGILPRRGDSGRGLQRRTGSGCCRRDAADRRADGHQYAEDERDSSDGADQDPLSK